MKLITKGLGSKVGTAPTSTASQAGKLLLFYKNHMSTPTLSWTRI